MKKLQNLLLSLVLLCACNEDMPTDVIDVFSTYSVPSVTYPDKLWYNCDATYSSIGFHVRAWHPKRNSAWYVYYSDRPDVGPENGTLVELPSPFDKAAVEQYLHDVGNVNVHECAQTYVKITDLKPATTYYYNVFYTDENGRSCQATEQSLTTQTLHVGSLVGYNTDINSATVRFIVTGCDPDQTVCKIYISEQEDCPLDQARLVCEESLAGKRFDSFGEITSWKRVNDLKLGTTYHLQGYMVCLGDTVYYKPSSFKMSDFNTSPYEELMGGSTTTNSLTLWWNYNLYDGTGYMLDIPAELPPYEVKLWVSRQPSPQDDPDALVFDNNDMSIFTEGNKLRCSQHIKGLTPSTTYYVYAQMTMQERQYSHGPATFKTKHPLTVLNGQDRATMVLEDGTTFDVVLVKAGSFMMGATSEQEAYAKADEKPVHQVTISHDFYMATCETTANLFHRLSYGGSWQGNQPVANLSHEAIDYFCENLTRELGYTVTLPTEAEWEYAARGGHLAGTQTLYAGSNNLAEVAVPRVEYYIDGPAEVATKKPNVLGLYDMSGNVWEACSDMYEADFYSRSSSTDPENPNNRLTSKPYVARGGSCMPEEADTDSRVSSRGWLDNDRYTNSHPFVGFRFVIRP